MFKKYVGAAVEVIYEDKEGNFTKRCVFVKRIQNGYAYVHCYTADAPRVLIIGRILAVQKVAS